MRLTSTPKSARAGEPSLLAIAETLAAMGASAWIGVHFGTWTHMAVGACIAPLLLLRTEESCQYAVHYIKDFVAWVDTKPGTAWAFIFGALAVPVTAIRVWATLVHVIPHPVIALSAFPGNWRRTTIALDSATSPEWIPLPADMSEHPDTLREFGQVYPLARLLLSECRDAAKARGWEGRIGLVILAVFIIGPLFVTAAVSGLAYRWSIKSTAIIWAPMLWALRPPKPKGEAWSAHLKLRATSDFNRIVVIFSTVVLLGFVVKYALFVAEHKLAMRAEAWQGWLGERLGEFVAAFVRPGEIPIWQLASATNAVLAIVVFFMVRSWLRHAEVGLPAPDARIDRMLGVLYFFRRLLTSYAIFCNGVVAIQLARKLPMPEIGSKLFPWL